jgi:hypothetical protein
LGRFANLLQDAVAMNLFVLTVVFAVPGLCISTAVAAPPSALTPEEDAALKEFNRVYKEAIDGVKSTRSSADDAKLGNYLVNEARKSQTSTGGSAMTILLYEKAYEFGKLHTVGFRAAADALQELSRLTPSRQLEMQERLLSLYDIVFRNAGSAKNQAVYQRAGAATADLMAEIAVAKGRRAEYSEAVQLLSRALGIAKITAPEKQPEIQKLLDDMKPLALIDRKVQVAERQLARDPADKETAKTLMYLYLRDLDRPVSARTYAEIVVAKEELDLYTLAGEPVRGLPAADAKRLAEWYASLAAQGEKPGQMNMLVRAKMYYERCLEASPADADAKAGLIKVDLQLFGLTGDKAKSASLVQARRGRLDALASATPVADPPAQPPQPPPNVPDPRKDPQPPADPKPPVKPADPKPPQPAPADNPNAPDPRRNDPPPVAGGPQVKPKQIEREFRDEELSDEYWKKRKSIFDF